MKRKEEKFEMEKGEKHHTKMPGYPLYPVSDDIYNQLKKASKLNPENLSENKTPNEKNGENNELDFSITKTGNDLDIPGAELDDAQETIGNEDEENNYYSLGGDDHNDLEEDRS